MLYRIAPHGLDGGQEVTGIDYALYRDVCSQLRINLDVSKLELGKVPKCGWIDKK
jgi:hypothetical protein